MYINRRKVNTYIHISLRNEIERWKHPYMHAEVGIRERHIDRYRGREREREKKKKGRDKWIDRYRDRLTDRHIYG